VEVQIKEHPDIIILETHLSGLTDGFRLINTLRDPYNKNGYADIPILLVTNIENSTSLQFNKIVGTRLLPVDGYLRKPVTPEEVLKKVKRILDVHTLSNDRDRNLGEMIILCLNCGSSSVKYKLYNWDTKKTLANGVIERVGQPRSICHHEVPERKTKKMEHDCPSYAEAIKLVLKILTDQEHGVINDLHEIRAVGHRVVHGGEKFARSVIITDKTLETFRELVMLAPLHNPPNIIGIETARSFIPGIPHVAVMDTAWHQTMPEHIYTYALPYEWYERYKIRKYGFHGTSLLYVSRRCAVLLGKDPFDCNLVICHIGNGVSLNAVKYGVSYDTSMGFTPLEGLVMGTRAGDHDVAVEDRRDLLAARVRNEKRAQLALDIECYRLKKYIGAYAAALGRIDAIVFTAGVGEMCNYLRSKTLDELEGLGIKYDLEKNQFARTRNGECDISATDSKVKIFVIPTDEERVFIEDVVAVVEKERTKRIKFCYRFQSSKYTNRLRDDLLAEECKKTPQLRKTIAKIRSGG
jgi:acetate kinase